MRKKSRNQKKLELIYSQLAALDDDALYTAYNEGEKRIKTMLESRDTTANISEKYTFVSNILDIIAHEFKKRDLVYQAKNPEDEDYEEESSEKDVAWIEAFESERIENLIQDLSKATIVKPFSGNDVSLLIDEYITDNKSDPLRDVSFLVRELGNNPVEPAVVARLHYTLICNTEISYKEEGKKNDKPKKTVMPIYTFFRKNLIEGKRYSSTIISNLFSFVYKRWERDFIAIYKLHLEENNNLDRTQIDNLSMYSDFDSKSKKFMYDFINGIDYMEYGDNDEKRFATSKVLLELTDNLISSKVWEKELKNKTNIRTSGSISYKDTINFFQAERPSPHENKKTNEKDLPIYLKKVLKTMPSISEEYNINMEMMHPTRPKTFSDLGDEYENVEDEERTLKKPTSWDKRQFKSKRERARSSRAVASQQKTFKYADGRKITIKRGEYTDAKWAKIKSLKSGEDWDKFKGK